MSGGSADSLLQQGIDAAKAKNRVEARKLLSATLELDPKNEKAWLWMASVVDDPQQRLDCLVRVLALNPAHPQARAGLAILQKQADEKAAAATPDPPVAVRLGNQGTSEYPPNPTIDDDTTLGRYLANVSGVPFNKVDINTPSADSGRNPGFQANTPRPREFVQLFEPYVVLGNGQKLLARNPSTGEFALYSSAPEFVARDEPADKLTEKGLVYYRTPHSLSNIMLDSFVEHTGALPEMEAVDMVLKLCDKLLNYYTSSRADSWLRTGPHGAHDVKVTEKGTLEPFCGFSDIPLTDNITSFLPPEFGKASQRDQRSDVYTLSSILYLLLTGQRDRLSYYRSRGRALLFEQFGQPLHPKIVKLLQRGLSLMADKRYPTVAAFRAALLEIHRIFFPPRRLLALVAVVAVIVLGIAGYFVLNQLSQNSPTTISKATFTDVMATSAGLPETSPASTTTVLAASTTAVLPAAGAAATTAAATPTSTVAREGVGRLLLQQSSLKDNQLTAFFTLVGYDNKPLGEIKSQGLRLFIDGLDVSTFKLEQASSTSDPLTVLFVMDTSNNMPSGYFEKARSGLGQFMQGLGGKNQAGLVRFSTTPEVAAEISEDKSNLSQNLSSLQASGESAVYDALVLASEQLKGRSGRKAIVLVTAGGDTLSPPARPSFLMERLLENDVNLYVMAYRPTVAANSVYKQLSELTGGYYTSLTEESQLTAGFDALNTLLTKTFKVTFSLNDITPAPVSAPKHRLSMQVALDEALYVASKIVE